MQGARTECTGCGASVDGTPTVVRDGRCGPYETEAPRVDRLCSACYQEVLDTVSPRATVRVFSVDGVRRVRIDPRR